MALLYITEFSGYGSASPIALASLVKMPALAMQTAPVGIASVVSAPFNAATTTVRLHTDVACSVVIGAAPVAVAGSMRMGANTTEYFSVTGGQQVAVITNS